MNYQSEISSVGPTPASLTLAALREAPHHPPAPLGPRSHLPGPAGWSSVFVLWVVMEAEPLRGGTVLSGAPAGWGGPGRFLPAMCSQGPR